MAALVLAICTAQRGGCPVCGAVHLRPASLQLKRDRLCLSDHIPWAGHFDALCQPCTAATHPLLTAGLPCPAARPNDGSAQPSPLMVDRRGVRLGWQETYTRNSSGFLGVVAHEVRSTCFSGLYVVPHGVACDLYG